MISLEKAIKETIVNFKIGDKTINLISPVK